MNSSLSPNVVKTALDKVFLQSYNGELRPGATTALDSSVFVQSSTSKAAEIVEEFAGSGYWGQRPDLAEVANGQSRTGNQQTHSVLNWAKSEDISKNLFDDQQFPVVSMMMDKMGRNARMTRDQYAFERYNLGFSSVLANDGVALFSASHITLGTGQTVSNLVSGALSEVTLETAINSLIEQIGQDGVLGGHMPATLLVPTALFKEATIYAETELRPTTTNNDVNYVSKKYPGLEVKQTPFLGATAGSSGSNTAWFLLSDNHSMYRWERQAIKTDLVDYKFQRNNTYIYKGEFREVVAPISWSGLVGSTGV